MKTVNRNALSVLIMSSILTACGGSGGGSSDASKQELSTVELTPGEVASGELAGEELATGALVPEELLSGVFSDSPVSGLNYVTQSTNGVTDADGVFHYREGETVVFSIGNLTLPVVAAAQTVTPLDMAGERDIDDLSVINIARLLQSLDEDANPENGIAITQDASTALTDAAVFDSTEEGAVEDVVSQVYGAERQAVSAEQAMSHFINTLSANADSDGTLEQLSYVVGADEVFTGDSLFVDQDTFSMTLNGEVHTGTASVNEGVYQLSGTQDTWFVSVDDTADEKLVCIENVPTSVADCESDLYQVFTDEAQAIAFNAPQNITEAEAPSELEIEVATDAAESSASIDQTIDQPTEEPIAELSLEELFPPCAEGITDDDGDGYGWQNEETCLITVDSAIVAENLTDNVVEPAPIPVTETPAAVETPEPAAEAAMPIITPVAPSDITDIIVLTGQSNASGVQTGFDATLDAGNERLFAFNEDGQWQAADLDQYWDENLPSNFASAAEGRDPYNNLVFQVGKSLAEQTDRVVGIILVTAPGEGISNWDYNSEFYTKIRNKVTDALATLPQKDSVDAMIWMQGETDWLAEGTADPEATGFSSFDSDFYRNYYPNKLNQLINNLRSEFWYTSNAQFICAETKKTNLNHHLMALNNDGDDRTSCAQASDLPTRDSDPFGNHYSGAALRTLGDRIAALYLLAAD